MTVEPLSNLDDVKLVNSGQDCRGWSVVDALGTELGTVSEMLVDKEHERVTTAVLGSGMRLAVSEISLRDGRAVIPTLAV